MFGLSEYALFPSQGWVGVGGLTFCSTVRVLSSTQLELWAFVVSQERRYRGKGQAVEAEGCAA